ncbi:Prolyl endopeptidase [Phytophthora nicotianae]|uniref:Prolyl endopeptidase n=1 Tax=Phytophthora nicotianae TaxID=4792 RepID=A0A0W8DR04_PHYNI|nr:Prolyl endopeptidase [Phytophthora nicotianae]
MSDALVATPRSKSKFTPKQIACFYVKPYLTEDGGPTGLQVCKACGKTRKNATKTGYTNLVSHVKSDHGNFEVEMEAASTVAAGTLLPWVRQKASNRHAWLKWIVKGNRFLSFVEMESTRRYVISEGTVPFLLISINCFLNIYFYVSYTILATVCEETITRDMESVTKKKMVERSIGDKLPKRFGANLDGWTHGGEHYLAVHACYDKDVVCPCPLLSMASIINGSDDWLNAESHMSFLPFFGMDLSNVIFLVGDNCAVNRRLAKLMGVPLVGCANNRLNLAVRRFLKPYEKELEQVASPS